MTRPFRAGVLALFTLIAVACGSVAQHSASMPPATFSDYDAAFCGAFTSLIRAYGNPDTNAPSAMRKALDDSVAAGDRAAADVASTAMLNELEAGRRLAATAARWQPGAATAGHLDRLLVAFEAWTTAKRDRASDPAALDPQTAFERAGGVDAWTATIQGVSTTPIPAGASPAPCRAFQGEV